MQLCEMAAVYFAAVGGAGALLSKRITIIRGCLPTMILEQRQSVNWK